MQCAVWETSWGLWWHPNIGVTTPLPWAAWEVQQVVCGRPVSRQPDPRWKFQTRSRSRWVWRAYDKGKGGPRLYGNKGSGVGSRGNLRHRRSVRDPVTRTTVISGEHSLKKFRFCFMVHWKLLHHQLLQSLLNGPRRLRLPSICWNTNQLDS